MISNAVHDNKSFQRTFMIAYVACVCVCVGVCNKGGRWRDVGVCMCVCSRAFV